MAILKRGFFISALLACVAGAVVSPPQAQEDEILWLESYRAAVEQARRTGKPIFLEFRCEP